jgi:hypothetical protein
MGKISPQYAFMSRQAEQKYTYVYECAQIAHVGLGLHRSGDLGPLLHGRVDAGRVVRAGVPVM